jgi:Ca-activated chloride channel family protein
MHARARWSVMLAVGLIAAGCGEADSAGEKSVPSQDSNAAGSSAPGAGSTAASVTPSIANGAMTSSAGLAAPSQALPLPTSAPPMAPPSSAGSSAPAPIAPPPSNTPVPTEKYPSLATQPFVLAAHDPFSTFGADVDTASYDVFRRNVEHQVPTAPESVRVEDFVNYFKYDYPAPAEGAEHPFKVSLAAAPNAFGRATTLLRVGIQAENPPPSAKKPTNLVFLIDTSGSMGAEDKLPLVQFLAKHALEILGADDLISIVTYSETATVQLAPTKVVQKEQITQVIDRLVAGGSTNGAGGIQLAYQQAQSAFIADGINHVMLCTDGDFNVGISDPEQLVGFIETERKSGITLTALGFGLGNLNDELMERVSNAGNGIYSVVTSQEQASRYAEERMLSSLRYVAKDMKIQLEWNPAEVEAYRLIGYEDRAIADQSFRDDKVDAGEVGAGHRVTALYEVVRKGDAVPAPAGAPAAQSGEPVDGDREIEAGELVRVKVRYKLPNASESDPAREVMQKLAPSEIGALFDSADQDLRWAAAIAAYAEILKHSPYALPSSTTQLRTVFAAQAERDAARAEFLKLFDAATSAAP